MGDTKRNSRLVRWAFAGMMVVGVVGMTGCQVSVGGQTLPSGNYLNDDVEYYPPGLEHQFPLESAALREAEMPETIE